MQPQEFSIRVAHTVEALRELKGFKQFELSDALGIDRSNYSRVENGHRPFTILELQTVSDILKISVAQIVLLADSSVIIDEKWEPLSELLLKFLSSFRAKTNNNEGLTEEELEFIFKKLREYLVLNTNLKI